MPGKVFISYSRWNTHFATRLRVDLERAGLDAWFDAESIPLGEDWEREIEEGIKDADRVVLLASPEAGVSKNVAKELDLAAVHNKPLVSLLIGGKESGLPPLWQRRQMVDATGGRYWAALSKLQ